MKEHAAFLIWSLGKENGCSVPFVTAGAIPLLVSLLHEGSDSAKERAAGALWSLCWEAANQEAFAAGRVIFALVQQLQGEGATAAVKVQCLWALGGLAHNASCRLEMITTHVIPLLVRLLGESEGEIKLASVTILVLFTQERESKRAIAAAGAIPPLLQLFVEDVAHVKEMAAKVLTELAQDIEYKKIIAAEGGMLLLQFLKHGADYSKNWTATILRELSEDAESRTILAADGAVPLLVQLLRGGSSRDRELTLTILGNLVVDLECRETLLR